MKGFVHVSPDGIESDEDLERWVNHGVRYARSLPASSMESGSR
jgi:hypothetical protein